MPRKRHMLSGAIYESQTENVATVRTIDGRTGRFDGQGVWLDGELREADPQLCVWVAGRRLPEGLAGNTKDLPLSERRQPEKDAKP